MTTGMFVTIDGPGGAGKSTITRLVTQQLHDTGWLVTATTEPSNAPAGELARHRTDIYHGHALACLVTADRYHHIDTQIRPALAAGHTVICDRYLLSSHVLQRLDGVDPGFIRALNTATEPPDLALILTGAPEILSQRLSTRGSHSRFENDSHISTREVDLYTTVSAELPAGTHTRTIDTITHPIESVVTNITEAIKALWSRE